MKVFFKKVNRNNPLYNNLDQLNKNDKNNYHLNLKIESKMLNKKSVF